MLYPGKSRLMLISDENGTVVRITVPYQVGTESPATGRGAATAGKPA